MNRFTKKQILIGGLILLIVINLAALGTFIYQNYQQERQLPPPPDKNRVQRDFREHNGPDRDRFSYFFRNKLDLNDKQFSKLRELRRKNHNDQIRIRKEIEEKTEEMMKELSSKKPDKKKLENINKEIGKLHMELNKVTIDHFLNLKENLNPDQRKELNKLIERMSKHRKFHRHGKRRMHNR
jgi:Spy/CpxP family protein refolding chaperone